MGEVAVQEQVSAQGIKLFGKTISLPPCSTPQPQPQQIKTEEQEQEAIKFNHGTTSEDEANDGSSSESTTTSTTTAAGDGHGHGHGDQTNNNNNNDNNHGLNSRPDKIIACPRCKSMETKFCYFNNYNVNQPRHFCKGCQRYWTAGGALRNVPVGAGRRKAKPPGRFGSVLMDQNSCAIYDASSVSVMNNYHEQMVDRVVLEEYWAHQQMMAAARAGVSVGVGGDVYNCDFSAKRRRINGPNGPVNS